MQENPPPLSAAPAPVDPVPPAATVYATFGQRLLAWVVDAAILLVIQFATLSAPGAVAMLVDNAGGVSETAESVLGWVMLACVYLVAWPYYALLEASAWQATVGKRAMGIRVEDVEGGNATFAQTSVRFILRIVSGLTLGSGYLMALFTARRQTLHDIGANCVVTVAPRTPLR